MMNMYIVDFERKSTLKITLQVCYVCFDDVLRGNLFDIHNALKNGIISIFILFILLFKYRFCRFGNLY